MARSQSSSTPARVRFDEFELEEANACLLCNGKAVALAPTPFNALVCQSGALLTKHALRVAVWGHHFITESILKTAISDLRTALCDNLREPRSIKTVSNAWFWIAGEPGIGKTTLIEHFVASLGGVVRTRVVNGALRVRASRTARVGSDPKQHLDSTEP
jgi:DNA-binding winged helix-turn-helix (wHTH) protein